METLIPIVQIVLSIVLIAGILLQQSDAGLGSAFGGADEGGLNRTRRGSEKIIFHATIVIAVLFVISSVIALLI